MEFVMITGKMPFLNVKTVFTFFTTYPKALEIQAAHERIQHSMRYVHRVLTLEESVQHNKDLEVLKKAIGDMTREPGFLFKGYISISDDVFKTEEIDLEALNLVTKN